MFSTDRNYTCVLRREKLSILRIDSFGDKVGIIFMAKEKGRHMTPETLLFKWVVALM